MRTNYQKNKQNFALLKDKTINSLPYTAHNKKRA